MIDDETNERFRFCVYCAADCRVDDPEHAENCPMVTGVWPVCEEEIDRCPHCGKNTREMACMDCHVPLEVGDFYALRDSDTGSLATRPHIGEVICLGCAARLELLEEAG